MNDWASRELQGTRPKAPSLELERRVRRERRHRRLWSLWYGGFRPRRRLPARRLDDSRFQAVDWYATRLFPVAIGIALLSMADAFLTTLLLTRGADEINPLMAILLYRGVAAFTVIKMGVTNTCVLALVVLSRYRFMRLIRVEAFMYVALLGYVGLIGYELFLLKGTPDPFYL
jgi:hypothetical protein